MKTGIELIAEERREQIEKHGYTVEDDSSVNDDNQLALGAMMLIDGSLEKQVHVPYDWSESNWRKMMSKPYKQRLIIAGALIAAEIDRLQHEES